MHDEPVSEDLLRRAEWFLTTEDVGPEKLDAVHEAGHAVAAVELRRDFVNVALEETEWGVGRIRYRDSRAADPCGAAARYPRRYTRRVLVTLAGSEAERALLAELGERLPEGHNPPEWQRDMEQVRSLIRCILQPLSEEELLLHIEAFRQRTRVLVREKWWREITVVAAALRERRQLSRRQVLDLVQGKKLA